MGSNPIIHLIFWKNSILKNYLNNSFKKKFLNEKSKSDILLNLKKKEIEFEEKEKKEFLDNLDKHKSRIKKFDLIEIHNWDSYKKKENFKSNYKTKKKIIEPLLLKINKIINLMNNINKIDEKLSSLSQIIKFKKNTFFDIKNKFMKLKLKKIFLIEKNKYFSTNKILYVIIDIRFLKTKIILFNKKKCLVSITNGLIFKKMNLNFKKNKKSEKTTNLLLKSLNNKINLLSSYNKIIIYIKGVKKYITNIIKYVNSNIKKNNFFIYIHSPKFNSSKKFGFKKIKSIKKRIKKKIVKLK